MAKSEVHQKFTDRQQAFVDFVLVQYVKEGVEELDAEKLTPLLRLRYNNAIADAVADLGSADQIRRVFWGPRSTCMRRVRIDGRATALRTLRRC